MDAQLRAVQSRGPSFGVRVRSRAHQTPFCARGHQKNIAVSENAPGAHGIVPRHCSTRAAGMNTAPAARPPPRNLHSETPATEQPLRHRPRRNAKAANSAAAALAAKPPPRMAAEVPLPSTSPRSRSSVSRAHQAPFYARGLQKIGAVSENAPGAHGIVPRHCSTRAAGMNTVSAARPPPRNLHSEAPAAEQPLRHRPRHETSAARPPPQPPPPRNPRRPASTSTRRAAGPDRRAALRGPPPCL